MARNISPLADNTKYYIVEWRTGITLFEYNNPKEAKKHCKSMGYEDSRLLGRMPFAYVAVDYKEWDYDNQKWSDDKVMRGLFYNPRF